MKFYGDGIPKNKIAATLYSKRAINKGDESAIKLYSIILCDDDKTSINNDDELCYIKLAVEEGNPAGMLKYANK